MAAIQSIQKRTPVFQIENTSQKLITYANTTSLFAVNGRHIVKKPVSKPIPALSTLSMVIPFQPSMCDEKTIERIWNNAIQVAEKKLKEHYSRVCTRNILGRLKKLFKQLNFNTHRKSLAVMLYPGEEKLIYLNYQVKPAVFPGSPACLLDLVTNTACEPEFYFLILHSNHAAIFECEHNKTRKVHEQKEVSNPAQLYKNAIDTIEMLNCNNEKPLFIAGSAGAVEEFRQSLCYADHHLTIVNEDAVSGNEISISLIKEITGQWKHWYTKFIAGRVMLAQKNNGIIAGTEAVLQALQKSKDGLLLMDKHLKHRLKRTTRKSIDIFQKANELVNLIEKFLARGNRIEIIKPGLFKGMGGIALLKNTAPGYTGNSNTQQQDNRVLF